MKHDKLSEWATGTQNSTGSREPGQPHKFTLSGALAPNAGASRAETAAVRTHATPAEGPALDRPRPTLDRLFGVSSRGEVAFKLETNASAPAGPHVQAIADAGLAGTSQALPHLDRIRAAFGHHDVGDVRAHLDGAASSASAQLSAAGYASGGAVAFRTVPDLHLAAHEAAHVVQQRAGVRFSSLGTAGDEYERHADAVADRVVAGQSAEALLDAHGGGGTRRAVQRELLETATAGVFHDSRGSGYGFTRVADNRYSLLTNDVVYNYNPETRQYLSDAGNYFDPQTEYELRAAGPGWYTRVDSTPGHYYYDARFHYVLYQPPPPPAAHGATTASSSSQPQSAAPTVQPGPRPATGSVARSEPHEGAAGSGKGGSSTGGSSASGGGSADGSSMSFGGMGYGGMGYGGMGYGGMGYGMGYGGMAGGGMGGGGMAGGGGMGMGYGGLGYGGMGCGGMGMGYGGMGHGGMGHGGMGHGGMGMGMGMGYGGMGGGMSYGSARGAMGHPGPSPGPVAADSVGGGNSSSTSASAAAAATSRAWTYNDHYWESDDGLSYYASEKRLMRDVTTVTDDAALAALNEVQLLEAQRASKPRPAAAARGAGREVRHAARSRESVDDLIRSRFRVAVTDKLIQFHTPAGKLAGQISWYVTKGRKLSFYVSKLEAVDGEHAGIGSMLMYWLMKYNNTGVTDVQIEAFESKRNGTVALTRWYSEHGFDAGMSGSVDEIQAACELKIRAKMSK